jgi:CHAT domain-containing protein
LALADVSTQLLMERFYENWVNGTHAAAALREAQRWLRDVSAGELAAYFDLKRQSESANEPYEWRSDQWRRFFSMNETEKPFASPVYWAAFAFHGVP